MSQDQSAEDQVLEIFHAIRLAMLDNDGDVLLEHVAEDYMGSDAGGRIHDREAMVEGYGPGGVSLEAFDVSEVETKAWESTVIVTGRARFKGSWGEISFAHDLRFLDVYANRQGAWQVVASHATDIADE